MEDNNRKMFADSLMSHMESSVMCTFQNLIVATGNSTLTGF
jgi:hypothetical protein